MSPAQFVLCIINFPSLFYSTKASVNFFFFFYVTNVSIFFLSTIHQFILLFTTCLQQFIFGLSFFLLFPNIKYPPFFLNLCVHTYIFFHPHAFLQWFYTFFIQWFYFFNLSSSLLSCYSFFFFSSLIIFSILF